MPTFLKTTANQVASRYLRSSLSGERDILEGIAQQARLKNRTLYLPALYRTGLEASPIRPSGAVWKISPDGSITFLHTNEN